MVTSKTELFNETFQQQANLFKALAHPARLQILYFLAETKTCISGDISEELPLGRTTVNQHLNELKASGLIQGHVEGVKTNYCLNYGRIEEMKKVVGDFLDGFHVPENFSCK
ncbi:MAG: metalloregulator ArsR/SmtB family transcription factor [Prolixibacteraceae bacterium]|jgi:DNA-binding transcriptional ArsR family regulator|nr:metalloregulator ArsR/SmtB family transcription factor [Prolixibacteraceae bacterium]